MMGRAFTWVTLVLLVILTLFTLSAREGGEVTINDINDNLSVMTESLQNMSQSIPYKDPYTTNFTMKDFLFNTAHVIFYPLAMELNTVLGVTINLVWKHLTIEFLKTLGLIILLWYGTRFFLSLVKPSGIIYVLLNEYWEKKWNKTPSLWISIPLAVLLAILFIILMWGIGIGIVFLISYFG